MKRIVALFAFIASAFLQTTVSADAAEVAGTSTAFQDFMKTATVSQGLLSVARRQGKFYLILSRAQLGRDFIETSVPSSGLGSFGPPEGEPYVAPARIMRFERVNDSIVMRWPNTGFAARPNSPQAAGIEKSFPSSVVAVQPIVAEDPESGQVIISADSFLHDVADYNGVFEQLVSPGHGYRLDPSRTFFAEAKAFPDNVLLRVSQTWASESPDTIDEAPDPRSLEVQMTYNIIAAPQDGYIPRIADSRVGYFSIARLDFSADTDYSRTRRYITRWNFMPEHPGRPSRATHPIVFYLSRNIPVEYRSTVRDALLAWNAAFQRVGILDAIKIEQQPADASWDPDDIRHNMVRWISTTNPQFGAEALLVSDPRTGEEINVGVNVDAVEGLAGRVFRYTVAPARGVSTSHSIEKRFALDAIRSVLLHESGHDFGLQHNYIGSMAYTAQQLQSKTFTSRYGIASSVMEYLPINLSPKGTAQGDFYQLVLGPYDYYAIQYGYGYVPNVKSADDEAPALRRWASRWNDPKYRFASDEDAQFSRGHAIDPRVAAFDLTNHPLRWCGTQLHILHDVLDAVDKRFPGEGMSFDEARRAFTWPLTQYIRCAQLPAHSVGGEYLSRATGKRSPAPLSAVSRSDEAYAWSMLSEYLFSDAAWNFNPNVLRSLPYSEAATFTYGSWAYAPSARHDVPIVTIAANAQDAALDEIFAPLTLQRIDDLSTKYGLGSTMSIADLFDWSTRDIYADIVGGSPSKSGVVRRNLQIRFAKRLAAMWTSPASGTPSDAQALARLKLTELQFSVQRALRSDKHDELSQAHLEALSALVRQALEATASIGASRQE